MHRYITCKWVVFQTQYTKAPNRRCRQFVSVSHRIFERRKKKKENEMQRQIVDINHILIHNVDKQQVYLL